MAAAPGGAELVADPFGGRLRDVVAAALGDPRVRLRELARLTGGASRQTWALEALGGDGAARWLILRCDANGGDLTSAGFGIEARALQAAAARGVPEPAVLAWEDDAGALGMPFLLMEHVEGETLARRILRDERFAAVRPRLAGQCGEIAARVHAIDPAQLGELPAPDPFGRLRTTMDAFEERSPAFELALRWLQERRPAPVAPRVVHGDFRLGNLIVGPEGIRAVLDWEMVHLGDPMEDFGFLCARAWRFGGAQPVGGFGAYEDLFAGYERAGGAPVDPARVRWWETWAALRWGVACMELASRHLSGALRSVEMAAIGRRVREQEYDLMRLIERAG